MGLRTENRCPLSPASWFCLVRKLSVHPRPNGLLEEPVQEEIKNGKFCTLPSFEEYFYESMTDSVREEPNRLTEFSTTVLPGTYSSRLVEQDPRKISKVTQ